MSDEQTDPLLALIHSAEQTAEASKQMALIFASYYEALKKEGVPDDLAIPLVLDFQQHLMEGRDKGE